ncbi:hypothetical protein AAVH_39806, partial [Aphelenchoides avenae]
RQPNIPTMHCGGVILVAVLAAVVTPSLSAGRFGSKAYFVEPAPYMDDAPVGMGGYRGFNSFIVRPAGSDPRCVFCRSGMDKRLAFSDVLRK